jgi:RNA polymerase sigma-70 factor (ECF subfamily)
MTRPIDDAGRWLSAARAGSPEALGQALEACRGYLLLIARKELGADLQAKAGASDLVQQTFLEAQCAFARFQGNSVAELRAWLRRLLLNNLATFARDYRATAKRAVGREVALPQGNPSGMAALVETGASPSTMAMAQEEADALRRVLERLPADYRLALLLRHLEELPFDEIGRRMGRSANAARKLWARAVEMLQQQWETPPAPARTDPNTPEG